MPERPPRPFIYIHEVNNNPDQRTYHFREPQIGLVINAIYPSEGDDHYLSFVVYGTNEPTLLPFNSEEDLEKHIEVVIGGWLATYEQSHISDPNPTIELKIPSDNNFEIIETEDGLRVLSNDPELQEIVNWMMNNMTMMTVEELHRIVNKGGSDD